MPDLNLLKEIRAFLAEHYVPWTMDDGNSGHCHLGAIHQACRGSRARRFVPINSTLDAAARRLHPELRDAVGPRPTGHFDCFATSPCVYINNQLGKDAILAVWDDVIATEEVAQLCREEESKCKPNSATVPTTETLGISIPVVY